MIRLKSSFKIGESSYEKRERNNQHFESKLDTNQTRCAHAVAHLHMPDHSRSTHVLYMVCPLHPHPPDCYGRYDCSVSATWHSFPGGLEYTQGLVWFYKCERVSVRIIVVVGGASKPFITNVRMICDYDEGICTTSRDCGMALWALGLALTSATRSGLIRENTSFVSIRLSVMSCEGVRCGLMVIV